MPGEGEHYVWGNERHNAFIKPITYSGEYEPVTTDVTLLDFQVENMEVRKSASWGQDALDVSFTGIKALVNNSGLDTLREVIINLPLNLSTNLQENWGTLPFPQLKVRVADLEVLPGHSFWLDAGDMTLTGYGPSELTVEFCVELSCPNNRIDASDANDKVCKEFNLLVSSTAEVEPANAIRAWPNPFTDRLQLEGLPEGSFAVSLVDVLGKELAHVRLAGSPSATIDLPPGLSGFYTLIVKDIAGQIHATIPLVRAE